MELLLFQTSDVSFLVNTCLHSAGRTTGNGEPESLSIVVAKLIIFCGTGKYFATFSSLCCYFGLFRHWNLSSCPVSRTSPDTCGASDFPSGAFARYGWDWLFPCTAHQWFYALNATRQPVLSAWGICISVTCSFIKSESRSRPEDSPWDTAQIHRNYRTSSQCRTRCHSGLYCCLLTLELMLVLKDNYLHAVR